MSKNKAKKLAILLVVAFVIVMFRIFHLEQYLSLTYLKESQARFAILYEQHRPAVLTTYLATYILVTTLSLPGAVVLTLAGGALFGLVTGTVLVSFASSIGATLACFVSRFLLRDWVEIRFGERLAAINAGMKKEGAFYLFTLRLIPIVPFFAINLVMGLTKMPLRTFYWVSQLGMLPATVVYVNAGKELGKIESLAGILSPGIILSFALLGLFPILAKKLVALYRVRRASPQ